MPAAADHPLRAAAFGCVAMTLAEQGELQESIRYADRADAMLVSLGPGIDKIRCRIRGCVTTPVAYQGDAERLLGLCIRGLDDARRSNDKFEELRSLVLLCSTVEDEHEAVRLGEEALELALELQVPTYVAWAPMMLATRLISVDPSRAESLLDQAIEAAVRIEHPWVTSMANQSLAMVQAVQGLYETAAWTLLSNAERSHAAGDEGTTWNTFGLVVPTIWVPARHVQSQSVPGTRLGCLVWPGRSGTGRDPEGPGGIPSIYLVMRRSSVRV